LQHRAEQLGVEIEFRSEILDFEALRNESNLMVAADGVNSGVRTRYASVLQPKLDVRSHRYIWYGTNQLFHGLTLTFRENESGVFAAHSYKFNQTTSTFIVECDPETWERAQLATKSDEETRNYLAAVFERDLGGHQLLSNNSKWINFVLVKNANWFFENLVLLGDALHTAHFSIGSGTKLAMEDAIALAECFGVRDDVTQALAEFTAVRRPVIEDYQAAAYESMVWFENAAKYVCLNPIDLAFSVMTRSGRISYEDLKQRDPIFIARYDQRHEQS
jgi:anthraniloyl-CoA monooxygenase